MQACKLTINTSVDGQETEFACEGELELSAFGAILRYRQEKALVTLTLDGETVSVERVGDYTLSLLLKRGVRTIGRIGIGGNEGEVEVEAYRIDYAVRQNSLLAMLRYNLIIGDEEQRMQLRITARV
ncbi:MAG: DUF1934 family protein [Clostridia bacterium]|nr:DUF1934 family protein [Clostridia bacterium]